MTYSVTPRRSRSSSRTRPASAWPRVAFMTAPTIAPAAADLAAADLVRDVGLGGEGLVDGGEQRPVVADDREAAGGDHLVRRALAGEHALDHLAGQLVVERALADERLDAGDVGRRDRQVGHLDAALVGDAGELAHPPLARGRLVGAGGDRPLDEVEARRR